MKISKVEFAKLSLSGVIGQVVEDGVNLVNFDGLPCDVDGKIDETEEVISESVALKMKIAALEAKLAAVPTAPASVPIVDETPEPVVIVTPTSDAAPAKEVKK